MNQKQLSYDELRQMLLESERLRIDAERELGAQELLIAALLQSVSLAHGGSAADARTRIAALIQSEEVRSRLDEPDYLTREEQLEEALETLDSRLGWYWPAQRDSGTIE